MGMTGTATSPSPTPTLSAGDRCDRCGAQAKVRVVLLSGELTFCSHHATAFQDDLKTKAVDWIDERHLIGD